MSTKKRPPVLSHLVIPGHGSGLGNGKAGDAKNPRVTEGCHTTSLGSGHLLYFREGDHLSQGGVGFLVNKVLRDSMLEVYIKLTDIYSLKVVQVYAPT